MNLQKWELYSVSSVSPRMPDEPKKFTRIDDCGIKSMQPIFETKMLIHQSNLKASLDEKILCGKISHQLDPEVRKMLVNGKFGNEDSTFHSGI